jgi:hypothetical protein
MVGCGSLLVRLASRTARELFDTITPPNPTMRSSAATLAFTVLFACQPADDRPWVVTPIGFGPVLAGLPVTELSRALGGPIAPAYEAGSACAYMRSAALPTDVLVMIQHDTVARVDVRARGVLTAEGVGVGDTEQRVLAAYEGRVKTSPHKYTGPTGHYLTVSAPPDSTHLIVFETDGRIVTTYRSGRRSAVELVEGCS